MWPNEEISGWDNFLSLKLVKITGTYWLLNFMGIVQELYVSIKNS